MASTGNKNIIKTKSYRNSKTRNTRKQRRMALFSSELAVLTHCLRDLTVPTNLWMFRSQLRTGSSHLAETYY
jgi:hypothetical protein